MSQKILIIEDDPVLSKMYAKKFEKDGFLVNLALYGEEGLENIRADKPDIVLLDVMLPKIDGYEVLKQIKADENLKAIPVVLSTNLGGGNTDKENALKMGAIDFLVKSDHTPTQIVETIKKILS